MAITFECEGCGKSYTVGDNLAGKTGPCKQCGQNMTVPRPAVSDPYGFDSLAEEVDGPSPLPPRKAAPSRSGGKSPLIVIAGGLGVLAVLVVIGIVVSNGRGPVQVENVPEARPKRAAPRFVLEEPAPRVATPAKSVAKKDQIKLPRFPEPGPAREIEPGITFREVRLGPPDPVPGGLPGHCGRLWLYLPAGEHPAKSLPCILMAGAGATLYSGMKLADGDVREHLPYVRAGYAVMAFDVDGMLENRQNPTPEAIFEAAGRFQAAQAGLVNAHIALEYVLAKVPEVDPKRITAAGHSSAGTLALLFAEHEPRLRSCVAYAPVDDIPAHFQRFGMNDLMDALNASGFGSLFTRYSPKTNEARLDRPLFLFYAQDDVSAGAIATFGDRLKAAGKPVTVSTVPSGGHVESVARNGIPAAIAWLQEQGR